MPCATVIGFALRGAEVKSTPNMRKAQLLSLMFRGACTAAAPLSKPGATAAGVAHDRLQCEAQMYSERQNKAH